jgi:hypothetical protein
MEMLQEIRSDIKEMLQNQARMEERMTSHSEEMKVHKEEVKEDFEEIRSQIQPVIKTYVGIKWLIGAILFIVPVASLFVRYMRG